jgi:hypothetical protein
VFVVPLLLRAKQDKCSAENARAMASCAISFASDLWWWGDRAEILTSKPKVYEPATQPPVKGCLQV